MSGYLFRKLNGRRIAFGPETPEYSQRFRFTLTVETPTVGLAVQWATDSGSEVTGYLLVGALGVHATIGRKRLRPDRDEKSTYRTRRIRGREVATWRNWRHLGMAVTPSPRRGFFRVEAGPLGFAVLPG